MGTIVGDYIGTTIGIQSSSPHEVLDSGVHEGFSSTGWCSIGGSVCRGHYKTTRILTLIYYVEPNRGPKPPKPPKP